MVSTAQLYEQEMRYLDTMTRAQLVEVIQACPDCLPADLRQRLEDEPTERLRLCAFAALLLRSLRRLRR